MGLDLSVRGFGCEIKCKNDPTYVFRAFDSLAKKTERLDLQHFGMRHRSMFRFCNEHENSVGFVVSQDGDIRAVTKVSDRVLVWDNIRLQEITQKSSSRKRPIARGHKLKS
jgi:hypothetical protein